MAVRVSREWLAASLVLVLGACSGKSGQRDGDVEGQGGETAGATGRGGSSTTSPGKTSPGKVVPPMGGYTMVGTAGEAPAGARAGFGGSFSAGAPAEMPGAGGSADDAPGIVVSAPGDLTVHESYGTIQVQLRLTAAPQADVKVELASADPTHAVVFPLSLTFTPENWQKPQAAIVAGVRDAIADDGNTVTIETLPAVSTDPSYAGMDAGDVEVFVIDETNGGIVVGPSSGSTSESGGTAIFNIVLTSQPTATVTIPLSSNDLTEGTVANAVVFEPSEWSKPHPVTVTGVDDNLSDGAQGYDIITGAAVSDDSHYDGVDAADVHLSNVDNE